MVVFPVGIYPMLLNLKIILFSWTWHIVLSTLYLLISSLVVSCIIRLKTCRYSAVPLIKPEMLDFNPNWRWPPMNI
jgi:hypothetical protein